MINIMEKNIKKKAYICITESLSCIELTEHCESIILQ